MTNSVNLYIVKQRDLLISRFGGRCQNPKCGSKERLEFAHVKPTKLSSIHRGRGRKERVYDVKKNPDCYRLLCHICHDALDAGRITLYDIDNPQNSKEIISTKSLPNINNPLISAK